MKAVLITLILISQFSTNMIHLYLSFALKIIS